MPSLIDDAIGREVLQIARCGYLEDGWCMKCNREFARDVGGNILRGKSKSIKVKQLSTDNDMLISRWQHLEC